MDITEVSLLHHVAFVLVILWLLSSFSCCHPVAYFVSLAYLYQVHERFMMRMRRKLQFEERKQANQKRVLCDSETVRWLNHAVEKIWPVCMEKIVSQKILLPIIPWFLDKYKPWTAKKAMIQHLYLGRNPPIFTEMRVLQQSSDDDHLVLELGMNFLTADDMSAILAVKLRKRLGFGMWAKMHLTGMHIEGKVLVGIKFLRGWPFLGRLRVCFVGPPYFQMTVKPIFNHGLDVTELPGIAGWLDKLLSNAFEQTLVEPNMLVVDMEKFASPGGETWFSVDEKEPIAFAKVEMIEAHDMKPADLNGLADPYVKGHLGPYRFRTKTQKKTLAPKWLEEFKIPICTWESPNVLAIQVRDKDHFVDDTLGDCSININDLRDEQRHDMWLPLQNVKMGRLHLAITILEHTGKGEDLPNSLEAINRDEEEKILNKEDGGGSSFASEKLNQDGSFASREKPVKVADIFEPIDIEGQKETGVWVHHPGSEKPQTWKPREGKNAPNERSSFNSISTGSGSADENLNLEGNKPSNPVRRSLRRISEVFHGSPKRDDGSTCTVDAISSPHDNIREVNTKEGGVKLIVDEELSGIPSSDRSSSDGKGNVKDMAKGFLKNAGKSARSLKHALSRKGSKKALETAAESDCSDENSVRSPGSVNIPAVSSSLSSCCTGGSVNFEEENARGLARERENGGGGTKGKAEAERRGRKIKHGNGLDKDPFSGVLEKGEDRKLGNGSRN